MFNRNLKMEVILDIVNIGDKQCKKKKKIKNTKIKSNTPFFLNFLSCFLLADEIDFKFDGCVNFASILMIYMFLMFL